MKSNWKRNSIIYIVILLVAVLLFSFLMPGSSQTQEVPLSQIVTMSQNGQIKQIKVDGDLLTVTETDGTEVKAYKETNSSLYDITGLNLTGVTVDVKGSSGINWANLIVSILPFIIRYSFYYTSSSARPAAPITRP